MCLPHGPLPDPHAHTIAGLEKGQEVRIAPGYGHPPSKDERTAIIAEVAEYSALTACGIMLGCFDGRGISLTGKRFEEFELSEEAKKILEEAASE